MHRLRRRPSLLCGNLFASGGSRRGRDGLGLYQEADYEDGEVEVKLDRCSHGKFLRFACVLSGQRHLEGHIRVVGRQSVCAEHDFLSVRQTVAVGIHDLTAW